MNISQSLYRTSIVNARQQVAKALSNPALAALCKEARAVSPSAWSPDHPVVRKAIHGMMAAGLLKAGVSTATGYNFYDLRGPAYLIFPANTPLIGEMARIGRVNDGVGTAAHWKATRNPNATNVYAGLQEGQRNAISAPDENDYIATYKEIGVDRGATFTAEAAGEGFTDVMGDEHLRGLLTLRLQEEGMTLCGNSGTAAGNNGFALGTCPTPTLALGSGGAIPTSTDISVACVAITAMGLNHGGQFGYGPVPTVAGGLVPSYTRTNQDGTTTQVNGGTSAISAMSSLVTTTTGHQEATATVTAVKGACGYAWFVSNNGSPTLANAYLYAITNAPTVTITAAANSANQAGSAAGLSTDCSSQATDFDGLLTYAFKYGLWTDMGGGSFTSLNNGQVQELETDLESLWTQFQAPVNTLWCSADVKRQLQATVLASNGGAAYRFQYERDGQNGLLGGFVVNAYISSYSMNPDGSDAIPIRIHPMLPPGTLFYDVSKNPYPQSRIPAVRALLVQRDYYSIEWPVVTRQWTFGTYAHEVLAHYAPWITAVRTGIGAGV